MTRIDDFEKYIVSGGILRELAAGRVRVEDVATQGNIALTAWTGINVTDALEETIADEMLEKEEKTLFESLDKGELIQRVKKALENATIPEAIQTVICNVLLEKR